MIAEQGRSGALLRLFGTLNTFLQRHPWLVPLLSFGVGWASFLLVQRGENLARFIAALVVLAWPWLMAEELLGAWLVKRTQGRISAGLLQFITQSLQLEILFFCLPFLIVATNQDLGQMVFTGIAVAATLVCTLDPIYMRRIAGDTLTHIAFQGFCSFLAGLVLLPIVMQWPLEVAIPLAWALTGVMLLIGLPSMLSAVSPWRRILRLALVAGALLGLWVFRAHIPPANLWVKQALITQSVSEDLVPGPPLQNLAAANLSEGVVAYAAIRAPFGLAQVVVFEWSHEGELQDNITATIQGGREEGYRLYTRKHNFPQDPRGDWVVNLRTPDGQLIQRLTFAVK